MTASETLTKAKDVLKERGVNRDGWYVNRTTRPGGCVCSIGAVRLATGGSIVRESYKDEVWSDEAEDFVEVDAVDYNVFSADVSEEDQAISFLNKALTELGITQQSTWGRRYYVPSVPKFNDTTTTDDEVFAVFDKAIALAKAEEAQRANIELEGMR